MVIGHADATGRASKNGAISQKRADAVQELLVEAGIPPRRITSLGEGDRMPIADNTTPEGRGEPQSRDRARRDGRSLI